MSPTSKPSAQLSVVLRWYDAVSNWKFDVLEEQFSEDYRHETLPSNTNDPPKNKAEGIEFAKSVGKMLGYTPLQVRRAFINWDRNHVLPQYEIFRFSETPGHIWVHVRPSPEYPFSACSCITNISASYSRGCTAISPVAWYSTANPFSSSHSVLGTTSRSPLSENSSTPNWPQSSQRLPPSLLPPHRTRSSFLSCLVVE
jgi:hypothetical protein